MLFRNIIFSALFAGVLAGLIYGLFQLTKISPIIHAAEVYEIAETDSAINVGQDHAEHEHSYDHSAWAPEDGLERILFTLGSTILTSISLAIALISLMYWHNLKSSKPKITWLRGLGWGLALMISFFAAPAMFGIHPEVPGTQAAQLEHRQAWWLLCVIATALGLITLYYAPLKFKAAGIILVALPHIIGAPKLSSTLTFANSDPQAISALTQLSSQFYTMTSIGMLIFCLALGALSGYIINRFKF